MQWYYPFPKSFPNQIKAWKRQPERVDLLAGGHRVKFKGLILYPETFKMRHYLFLSISHAVRKYIDRKHDAAVPQKRLRSQLTGLSPEKIELPSQEELHHYTSDDELALSNPWTRHVFTR